MQAMTAEKIVLILRQLTTQVGADELAVLRVCPGDAVAWGSFPSTPACTLPGIDVGQKTDARFSIAESKQGLHVQSFAEGHIDLHLDEADACRGPIEHLAADTKLVEGAALGAFIGLVIVALTGGRAAVLIPAVAGVGAALGAATPAKTRRVFRLRDLLHSLR